MTTRPLGRRDFFRVTAAVTAAVLAGGRLPARQPAKPKLKKACKYAMVQLKGGSAIGPSDFHAAFLLTGLIAASSVLMFITLSDDAGAQMTKREPIAAPDASDQRVG